MKTKTTSHHIYKAVGQLVVNSPTSEQTERILVIPEDSKQELEDHLTRRGVRVLRYRWKSGKPLFVDLDECVRKIRAGLSVS